jgi:hypothetical protein
MTEVVGTFFDLTRCFWACVMGGLFGLIALMVKPLFWRKR